MKRMEQNLNQYSITSKLLDSELENISDDSVNAAYNYFAFESMKYYKHSFVSIDRNFRPHKDKNPTEWQNYVSVIRLCHKNKFNLRCYIKYCFLNKLVPKARGKVLSDIVLLRNYPQVMDYAKDKSHIEWLYKVYESIQKTIRLFHKISKDTSKDVKTILKEILSSGKFVEYIQTGILSRYFITLIPNMSVILHKFVKNQSDNDLLIDFYNNSNRFMADAFEAMRMFEPSFVKKTILELCE